MRMSKFNEDLRDFHFTWSLICTGTLASSGINTLKLQVKNSYKQHTERYKIDRAY